MDITYNQSMLAKMMCLSPNTVSRAISSLKIKQIDENSESSSIKRYCLDSVSHITNSIFASTKRPILQKTHVFYNFKGGTGKTSLCYQMATHLAILGFKVLALDLDPQGHLSLAMQVGEEWSGPTIYDVLIGGENIKDCLIKVLPRLDFLPANIAMTRIEVPLNTKTKREEKLKVVLDSVKDEYDFIIMDTNPTISILNLNALVASDRINIVCETQPFSLSGLRVLVKEMEDFFSEMEIVPNYCIIPNKYEIKTATAQEVLGALRSEYGAHMLNAMVRKSEDINISAKKKIPLSAFCKAKSTAFEDIMDLLHELIKQSQIPFKEKNNQVNVAVGAVR